MKIYRLNEGEMQFVKISKALRTKVIQQLYLLICWMLHQVGIFHTQDFPLCQADLSLNALLLGLPTSSLPGLSAMLITPFCSSPLNGSLPDPAHLSLSLMISLVTLCFFTRSWLHLQRLEQSLAHGRCSPNTRQLNKWRNICTRLWVPRKGRIRSLSFDASMAPSVPGR